MVRPAALVCSNLPRECSVFPLFFRFKFEFSTDVSGLRPGCEEVYVFNKFSTNVRGIRSAYGNVV